MASGSYSTGKWTGRTKHVWNEGGFNKRHSFSSPSDDHSHESRIDPNECISDPFDLDTTPLLNNVTTPQKSCKQLKKIKTKLEKEKKMKERQMISHQEDSKTASKKEAYIDLDDEILPESPALESIFHTSGRFTNDNQTRWQTASEEQKLKSGPLLPQMQADECEKCEQKESMIWKLKNDIDKFRGDARDLQCKVSALETQIDIEKSDREEALLSLQTNEYEINQLKSQLEKEINSKEEALSRLGYDESEIYQLKIQLENERMSKQETLSRLRSAESEINQLKSQLENERKTKEEALIRLNRKLDESENEKVALKLNRKEEILVDTKEIRNLQERQLTYNTPNPVELSDPNRPTKLSEQFSELYDNEWTDAFDELEKLLSDKEEKQIISYLRDFVLDIHSVCSDLSLTKMKTIEEAIVKPSVPSENTKIPTEILRTIKDGIKSMAPNLLEHTRELVHGHLEERYLHDPVAGCLQHHSTHRYIDRCTEVCWYMSVQDPQLVIDGSKSPGEKFDSNKYRIYTKKGPYEEFVVWPTLYLYKGGPMLSKGVAQGTKKR